MSHQRSFNSRLDLFVAGIDVGRERRCKASRTMPIWENFESEEGPIRDAEVDICCCCSCPSTRSVFVVADSWYPWRVVSQVGSRKWEFVLCLQHCQRDQYICGRAVRIL